VGCRVGLARASAVAGWGQGAIAGVAGAVATGAVATGAVVTGAVVTGAVVTGMAVIGAITITDPLILSSSAASAFRRGGGGGIPTDTTVTVTRTITTATAMATMATDMVVATDMITVSPVTGTARAADQGSLNCSGGSLALAIIAALLTASWGPRRGEQFELTSATMEM
jgi:hypothetical protein